MSDQEHDNTSDSSTAGGLSRRNALKAGVAVGVGAIAWSGPTITSLGGTPVYAAGCTFAIDRRISGDDRNTDQSSGCVAQGGFGYHQLPLFTNMPAGFTMFNPQEPAPNSGGWNSQVCSTILQPYTLVLTHPGNLDCEIHVVFNRPNQPPTHTFTDVTDPSQDNPDGTESVTWRLPTGADILASGKAPFHSSTRYSLFLRCLSEGTDPACFDQV